MTNLMWESIIEINSLPAAICYASERSEAKPTWSLACCIDK